MPYIPQLLYLQTRLLVLFGMAINLSDK